MSNQPLFLRGSLITLKRKCGNPDCKCAGKDGIPHESPALSCTIGGKSHVITLKAPEVELVRAALDRYQTEIDRLEGACKDGIAFLRTQVDARRSKKTDR